MDIQKLQGKLTKVNAEIKANTNGTLFRTCFVEVDGIEYFAKIWEKSFQNGVEIGADYTIEAQLDGNTVWLTVLNGSSAKIATASDFAHLFANVTV